MVSNGKKGSLNTIFLPFKEVAANKGRREVDDHQ